MSFVFIFFIMIIVSVVGQADGVLRIGFIDSDPSTLVAKNSVIADYLAKNLNNKNITGAKIVVAASVDEMIKLLNAGGADIFIDTIYPVSIVDKSAKIDVALRRWKKGVGEYKTLFIAKKDSSISGLANLEMKRIGFEDPTSSSTRWIPQGMLAKEGYKLVELSAGGTVPKGSVGYVYTGAAENMSLWIMQGKIDLACISSTDYPDIPEGMKSNIKILAESKLYPRQLVAFNRTMDKGISDAVKSLLLAMDKDPAGRQALKDWEKTAKLDPVTPEMLAIIKEIEQTFAYLKN
jgi:phosphonate transport system substrate-binding protein